MTKYDGSTISTTAHQGQCATCGWHGEWKFAFNGLAQAINELEGGHYKGRGYCPTLDELTEPESVHEWNLRRLQQEAEPPSPPESALLGWWAISGEALIDALRRVHAGEDPDLIYAELYANSTPEDVEGL